MVAYAVEENDGGLATRDFSPPSSVLSLLGYRFNPTVGFRVFGAAMRDRNNPAALSGSGHHTVRGVGRKAHRGR